MNGTENLTDAVARERLRSIQARYMPERSSKRRQVYWSGTTKRWIAVERASPGRLQLSYHNTCPCAG